MMGVFGTNRINICARRTEAVETARRSPPALPGCALSPEHFRYRCPATAFNVLLSDNYHRRRGDRNAVGFYLLRNEGARDDKLLSRFGFLFLVQLDFLLRLLFCLSFVARTHGSDSQAKTHHQKCEETQQ